MGSGLGSMGQSDRTISLLIGGACWLLGIGVFSMAMRGTAWKARRDAKRKEEQDRRNKPKYEPKGGGM